MVSWCIPTTTTGFCWVLARWRTTNYRRTISKPDRRYSPVRHYDAVETEALGQANIVAALRLRLDELMPEPLADVLERQDQQRARVAAELRRFTRRTQA